MHRSAFAACCAAVVATAPCAAQGATPSASADWKRGAVCYEIFVRSFYDSDGDGIGDIDGLIEKLDYINDGTPDARRDLGARCIWLMPVAASPSYHGYDVKNYYRVNPEYGTNDDFKRLVVEAHRRGVRVLVDMVLNHASSEHPYFKDALLNTNSPYRAWFRWSPTKPDLKGPWGQEVWHRSPVREEYYYGIFWSGMPDLNYEEPAVREEAKKVATFWLQEMGADGFRLDAIPYLVEEGDRLNGSPGTHAFLREYAAHIRRVAPHAYTVGEVWDSIAAMLPYYPDQLDAHFAFAASEALLEAARTGSAKQLYEPFMKLQHALPADRWSPFLRNHDQTRTMTVFGGDIARAKLAVTLLLTMPGLPYIYYGEEIGMTADKPDPRLRTPMHWTRGPAAGFTRGAAWEPLQPDSMTANVEPQDRDPTSLLNLHRRLIHLRGANAALGGGALVPLTTSSEAVAAYVRRDADRPVLVIANLGGTPVAGVRLSSPERTLTAGRYAATDLLGGSAGQPVRVGGSGRFERYVPIRSLAPREIRVLELSRRR
ncbi:MAG: alpha-amylase family glycosyl hydrolase [Gemmatimonadaceae bacterium]